MTKRRTNRSGLSRKQITIGLLISSLLVVAFFMGRLSAPSKRVGPSSRPPRVKIVAPIPPKRAEVPAASFSGFPKGHGKIAVILDDWGYNLRNVPYLTSIRQPFTVSILPNLPHSEEVAQAAKRSGHEVMLHLPLEAEDLHAPRETGTILTTMSKQEVRQRLDDSLAAVPFVSGVNNHQGSKATKDAELMETIFSRIKRRNLYFVDSMTGHSVCAQVARQIHLRFGQRSIFLDNEEDPAKIRVRLADLAAVAAKKGKAIAIGHDRPVTLRVLQESLPALEQAGYELVPASALTDVPS